MVVMTITPNPAGLPEMQCHRTRDHAPHVVYTHPGPGDAIGYCLGVGTFDVVVEPPADPFAGIPDDEEF
jgi:hypothetical protein